MKLFNFSVNNDFGPIAKLAAFVLAIWLILKLIIKVVAFPFFAIRKIVKKRFPNPMEF